MLHELGPEAYARALADHRRLLRQAFERNGGVEVDTQGDAFFVAFPTAPGALQAAAEGTEGLGSGPIRVRIGIHTGTPLLGEEGCVGVAVHRRAGIAACGRGRAGGRGRGRGGGVGGRASTGPHGERGASSAGGKPAKKSPPPPAGRHTREKGHSPPITSLYRTNLPVPSTPFLGRERELQD